MSRNPRVDKDAAANPRPGPETGPPAGETRHDPRPPGPDDRQLWDRVLAHRPLTSSNGGTGTSRDETAARFIATGVTPGQVAATLADGGDALYRAAASAATTASASALASVSASASASADEDTDGSWAEPFGGLLAVALLAAEVSAFTSHLNSRAAGVRSLAVDRLLDDLSAVTVAARLGVSRQKVYDVARGGLSTNYIDTVPWGRS